MHTHNHTGSKHTQLGKAFRWGIVLNLAYVAIEFTYGIIYDSMGLLSDAGHNLSDVAALILSFVGLLLSMKKPDGRFTYGYKKATILVSLLNAVILVAAVAFIVRESIMKLITPQPVDGLAVAWVAAVGVVVNWVTMMLFRHERHKDLNVRGAYLHMLADALVSVGVVVSGIAIYFTGWYVIDPVIGLVVSVIILISAWGLLKESVRLSLDGVPEGVTTENVVMSMKTVPGVMDVHHVHVWAISTTENALTAHVVINDLSRLDNIRRALKKSLEATGISHVTLEFETPASEHCADEHTCA